jgi:hypothetical protein
MMRFSVRVGRIVVGVIAFVATSTPLMTVAESAWRDPHAQRLDGFVEGREFLYNMESFLHRFSYRQLSSYPGPGDDGLYGTGGSITGDELYLEANFQKTLMFDNGRYAVITRMQRREDFDGRFDRQLLGIKRHFGERWDGALVADISGDKGLVNFQYEATWRPDDDRRLRMAVVQMNRLYNNKGNSNNKYERTPTTYFVHYQQHGDDRLNADIAINFSPETQYQNRLLGLDIRSEQLRIAGGLQLPLGRNWVTGLDVKFEQTDRRYQPLSSGVTATAEDFSRRMHQIAWTLGATLAERPWHAGIRYFELDEQGWLGQNLAASGQNQRQEVYAFAGVTLRQSDRGWWEPTLYIGQVDLERELLQRPLDSRNDERFVAKLTTAWRQVIHAQSGAVLAINPTFRLHSMNFGGGNVQLHWPL